MLSIIRLYLDEYWSAQRTLVTAVIGLILWLGWPIISYYVHPFFHVYLGIGILPIVLRFSPIGRRPNRFIYVSIGLFILFMVAKSHMLVFAGLCFLSLGVIELLYGRVNNLPVVLVLMLSPLTIYFLEILGFPLRLKLAGWSTDILGMVVDDIVQQGNRVMIGGFEIVVDKSCAGLRMITTGMLSAIAFAGVFERRENKSLSFIAIAGLLAATFGIIVFANLIRIVLLILFRSPPESFSHELIGLVCYAALILPMAYGISWAWVAAFARYRPVGSPDGKRNRVRMAVPLLIALSLMIVLRTNFKSFHPFYTDSSFDTLQVDGFDKLVMDNGVLKLSNDDALVYVKPPQPFYSGDHTPVICWRGSGYTFQSTDIRPVTGSFSVNVAKLVRGDDVLHTAWYYGNSESCTPDHFLWRWRQLLGEPGFRLINVTSDSPSELECWLEALPGQLAGQFDGP